MKNIFTLNKRTMEIAGVLVAVIVTLAIAMLIYVFVLKNKSDLRVLQMNNNPEMQKNIPQYTTVTNNYSEITPLLENKLKAKYPELQWNAIKV